MSAAGEGAAVASLGELLVEFVCTEKDGHNRRATAYVGPFPSGAPGIFIDQAARVGARAIFAGAVGSDAFGTVLTDRLGAVGVSDALIRVVDGVPTGSAFVAYNSDGSRDFVFNIAHSAAARLPGAGEAIAAFIAHGTGVFHISGSSLGDAAMRETALAVARGLAEAGVAISFDPNIRKELLGDPGYFAAVAALTALSTYVLPSEEDAAVLFPGEAFEAYADRLIAAGAESVVLKRGAAGCLGRDRAGATVERPAHRVEVVDPTGAGDCFCATYVGLRTLGLPFAASVARANAAGALAVGRLGPMEGNSDRPALERLLEPGS
ncbi:sugar kinase [Prosthecomicrobium pneumaticum]|uniref:Sugar/nucleoside kinase (Ribokinase family) n=1 Tax=Prosthecomicrobium pneumaticum TaxID=81895 RepID=A0A7W9CTK0_9HYPH|nr:sugar kinase [Prosthecomicrobium pneumaticum]MBB5751640.1 sugar/nucleoside kinase (ribokinase family) [Prosthecomicrobium pneumaticum]